VPDLSSASVLNRHPERKWGSRWMDLETRFEDNPSCRETRSFLDPERPPSAACTWPGGHKSQSKQAVCFGTPSASLGTDRERTQHLSIPCIRSKPSAAAETPKPPSSKPSPIRLGKDWTRFRVAMHVELTELLHHHVHAVCRSLRRSRPPGLIAMDAPKF
jgi:hypothetical protein